MGRGAERCWADGVCRTIGVRPGAPASGAGLGAPTEESRVQCRPAIWSPSPGGAPPGVEVVRRQLRGRLAGVGWISAMRVFR